MKGRIILRLTGLIFFILVITSYFVKIEVDRGNNFSTNDSLLGIIILHNPFILLLYILIGSSLIIQSYVYKSKK